MFQTIYIPSPTSIYIDILHTACYIDDLYDGGSRLTLEFIFHEKNVYARFDKLSLLFKIFSIYTSIFFHCPGKLLMPAA
jgi:hypothetical protein